MIIFVDFIGGAEHGTGESAAGLAINSTVAALPLPKVYLFWSRTTFNLCLHQLFNSLLIVNTCQASTPPLIYSAFCLTIQDKKEVWCFGKNSRQYAVRSWG